MTCGPNDVSLLVLCSDARTPLLRRCVDSVVGRDEGANRAVQEVIVGYETTAPDLGEPPPGIAYRTEKIGRISNFAEARSALLALASKPWAFVLDADEIVLAPFAVARKLATREASGRDVSHPLAGHIGVQIAIVQAGLQSDLNAIWIPVETHVRPDDDRATRRIIERRLFRIADGWEYRGCAYPELVKVGNDSDGNRIPEKRAIESTLVVRRLPADPRDVTGAARRLALVNANDSGRAATLARIADSFAILSQTEALAELAAASTSVELGVSAPMLALAHIFEKVDADLDAAQKWLAQFKAVASIDNPYYLGFRLALASYAQDYAGAADCYPRWRSTDARWDAIRYEDFPAWRAQFVPLAAAEAYANLGNAKMANRALADIPEAYVTDEIRMVAKAIEIVAAGGQ